ncbi:MAG: hypothetical protein NC830_06645, partial [Candidatus Omnitrophica bacterium]|nr:hypothetical protein [Candidatus Omnitrophota bacterium]
MDISGILLVATDVDGVLTDGKIFFDINGKQGKFFSIKDGVAFRMLKIAGLKSAIISGKTTGIVKERVASTEGKEEESSVRKMMDESFWSVKKTRLSGVLSFERKRIIYISTFILLFLIV